VEEQREAIRHLPDDRTVVVERFRDELGDWRLAVHCLLGAKVNGAWAMAISRRIGERYGVDAQVLPSDDGIVVRLPDVVDTSGIDAPPGADLVAFDPEEIAQIVEESVGSSAMFAARFRECAARALLLPRRDPRRRQPLWQQRQRAAQLLDVAREFADFPITLEAARECLQDVLDVPGLVALMRDIAGRKVRLVEAETQNPSPFARSLLFGYVGAFLYGGDVPLAERRAAALALDSRLLGELLGRVELRELLDPEVVAETERRLQWLDGTRTLRDAEDVVGCSGCSATFRPRVPSRCRAGTGSPSWPGRRSSRSASAASRADRSRTAGSTAMPSVALVTAGVYRRRCRPDRRPGRPLRAHAPFTPRLRERFGLAVPVVEQALKRLAATAGG
jgi:ATP-dependent Lhr-like helicase